MTEKSWKKRTAIAGIAAMLIVSGNLPINLVAEDNDNPAPDTTETITEENTAPDISDSETDSEDNTNTETPSLLKEQILHLISLLQMKVRLRIPIL